MKRIDLQTMQYIEREMKATQEAHPKATVYYDVDTNEIRITYPLPQDLFKEGFIKNIQGLK